jgi:hypothetical protein
MGSKVCLTIFTCWYKGLDPEPDPYLVLVDLDPGGPKLYGSYGRRIRIHNTGCKLYLEAGCAVGQYVHGGDSVAGAVQIPAAAPLARVLTEKKIRVH